MFIYLKKIISDRNDIPNINIIPINKLNTNLKILKNIKSSNRN